MRRTRPPNLALSLAAPHAIEEGLVPEALPWPVPQVLHGLGGSGVVESAELVVPTDNAHDLEVDDVGRRVVGIRG